MIGDFFIRNMNAVPTVDSGNKSGCGMVCTIVVMETMRYGGTISAMDIRRRRPLCVLQKDVLEMTWSGTREDVGAVFPVRSPDNAPLDVTHNTTVAGGNSTRRIT